MITENFNKLNKPYGGELINRIDSSSHLIEQSKNFPSLTLSSRELSDLEMISVGGFSPLKGFMNKKDYESVVNTKRLAGGLPWTIPVVLSTDEQTAKSLKINDVIALKDNNGKIIGVLELSDIYTYNKELEAQNVYGTADEAHPGVAYLYNRQGAYLLGGEVWVFEPITNNIQFPKYHLSPYETREIFAKKGWTTIVGFQTRNPVHRAHEYIQKCAMETVDGLFLHPLVGETKSDDIPAPVRMACYDALLKNYYPESRVHLGILPAAMRYAGPKEAIFHAIIRKNYGCSHFIIGRDHAGVGSYYGTFDAHYIFNDFAPNELGITPMFFDNAFFCKSCNNMATYKTCPHDKEAHVSLSGTKVRQMLSEGTRPPSEFSRPEVADILIDSYKNPQKYTV